MRWWQISVEARSPLDAEPLEFEDPRFDAFLRALSDHSPVGGSGTDTWIVYLCVEATTPWTALEVADEVIAAATESTGLPAWPFVRFELIHGDEVDRLELQRWADAGEPLLGIDDSNTA